MPKKKLNREQLTAIKYTKGPLLIVAGAGTGKTTVITEKIKYLIKNNFANPQEILALTFTEKASFEMQSRVDEELAGFLDLWIMTFHSFCDRILREYAFHVGLPRNYKLLQEQESIALLKKNIFKLKLDYFAPLGNPTKFLEDLKNHFSRLQDENITPSEYLKFAKGKKDRMTKELAQAYKIYDEIKIKESFLDFGDLITKTIQLLKTRPNIRKIYQEKFKYFLIDEFQDTNYAQNELALLLVNKDKNITVVGDDDQAIYRFRGAAISNILNFRNKFPDSKVIVLNKNYRSPQIILDKAYDLIKHNNPDRLEVTENVNKKLISTKKLKGKIKFIHKNKETEEVEEVAKNIIELTKKSYDFKDIAILVRANNHANSFIKSFERLGIPYQFLGPEKLFQKKEVLELTSYLKVLQDPDNSASLFKVLSIEELGIRSLDLIKISNLAKKKNISLFDSCKDSKNDKILNIVNIVENDIEKTKKETGGQILFSFWEKSGILSQLSKNIEGSQAKIENIAKFFEKIKTFEENQKDPNIFNLVDWIDLNSEKADSQFENSNWQNTNAVNILTVHASKGLEFPVVFLVNLVSLRFPSLGRSEVIPIPNELIKETLPKGDYHLEEERRLFYVGVTRAKEKLFLTAANYYADAKREKKLSPFIFESLRDAVVSAELPITNPQQLTLRNYEKALSPLHVDYLSYSQIETFQICPLHYKLRYILKLPPKESASQSFGISIHNTLEDFYEEAKIKKINLKSLFNLYQNNWINQGFLDKIHEEKFFQKGKEMLKNYYQKEFNKKNIPILLEQNFVASLTHENQKIQIGGKIDRVDELSNGTIEIIHLTKTHKK
ncbi:UvrD-helicase domain-containing protein [Candidatus Woesebacteria bacterium]|nr:UvrD-helicase domain-containing protein [Candidatus Woesebacteria bacterium]